MLSESYLDKPPFLPYLLWETTGVSYFTYHCLQCFDTVG